MNRANFSEFVKLSTAPNNSVYNVGNQMDLNVTYWLKVIRQLDFHADS